MRDFEDIKMDILSRVDAGRVAEWCRVGGMKRVKDGHWTAPCPIHAEKSASFHIGGGNGFRHRFHCYGCGWDGDVFAFWQQVKGCDFKQALTDLARECGVSLGDGIDCGPRRERPVVRQPERRLDNDDLPPELPPLRHLKRSECETVANARGLDAEAAWLCARQFGRMAFSEWPLYRRRDGAWLPRCEVHGKNGCALDTARCVAAQTWPSWCAIDQTRQVAEFRRLDNGMYEIADGKQIKTWSTRGKNWPLGASMINGRPCVLLVEGGPDMLAGYHFLRRHGMLERVAVVCMLGAGNRMREESLRYFAGKRVRVMADADALKDDENARKRRVPGMEAANRWQEQLRAAGAAVETFCVGPMYEPEDVRAWGRGDLKAAEVRVRVPGLTMRDGTPVKDLNDLAKCALDVTESTEVVEAFRAWDF